MFGPTMQQIDEMMKLPSKERHDRFLRKAIQEEQAQWAESKLYNASSTARPHQLLACLGQQPTCQQPRRMHR